MALAYNFHVLWEFRSALNCNKFCEASMFACNAAAQLGVAVGLDFVFHMFFLIKYSKSLEEGSFRGRSADFLWMLLIGLACYAAATHKLRGQ